MDHIDFEKKKLEYKAAQEMLRHYDSLNWQIGAILIAATIVLTGLVLRKEVIDLIYGYDLLSWCIVFGIPVFSFFILICWLIWFRRHRELYNFRNEVLHRLELSLGLFHHLRTVEADKYDTLLPEQKKQLDDAKSRAGHDGDSFVPFYNVTLSKPSGFMLAKVLVCGIPLFQLVLFLSVKLG